MLSLTNIKAGCGGGGGGGRSRAGPDGRKSPRVNPSPARLIHGKPRRLISPIIMDNYMKNNAGLRHVDASPIKIPF